MIGAEGSAERVDAVFRYGERINRDDPFSEVLAPPPKAGAESPRAFPQRPGALNVLLGGANGELEQSDDAFQLRVQAPAGAFAAPVVVFIPGGGFMTGTGNARWFTSPALVDAGVVLVTVNYRVGALGHLGDTGQPADSQRGLRDLVHALRWVHANIGDFGGDPGAVTLAGDSAGAWYAFALSTMQEAEGLFTRTALISLPWEPPLSEEAYAARGAAFRTGLESHGSIGSIGGASTEARLEAQSAVARAFAGQGMALMPASGGPVPTWLHDYERSARSLHVAQLALISTSEEAAAFLLPAPEHAFQDEGVKAYLAAGFRDPVAVSAWVAEKRPDATAKQRMIEAMTLHQFRLANLELAAAASAAGVTTFVAGFDLQSPLPGAGSPHCFPLPFLFGGREQWRDAPMLDGIGVAEFERAAVELQDWFLGFVRSGVPLLGGESGASFDPQRPTRVRFGDGPPAVTVPSESGLTTIR